MALTPTDADRAPAVACPECGAGRGEPCMDRHGCRYGAQVHASRVLESQRRTAPKGARHVHP